MVSDLLLKWSKKDGFQEKSDTYKTICRFLFVGASFGPGFEEIRIISINLVYK